MKSTSRISRALWLLLLSVSPGLFSCSSGIRVASIAKVKPGQTRGWRLHTSHGELALTNLGKHAVRVHLTDLSESAPEKVTVEVPAKYDHVVELDGEQHLLFENPSGEVVRIQYGIRSSGVLSIRTLRGANPEPEK